MNMALSVGFEPTVSCLEGKHIIRLCYESIILIEKKTGYPINNMNHFFDLESNAQ